MTRYAARTTVSSAQSRDEIERTLARYGATGFAYAWQDTRAVVSFVMRGRQVRFMLEMPSREDRAFTHHSKGRRAPEAATRLWEQATRQRWRALALLVKAKVESVEGGITGFDEEFLSHLVLPGGETVGDRVLPEMGRALAGHALPPLLPAPRRD